MKSTRLLRVLRPLLGLLCLAAPGGHAADDPQDPAIQALIERSRQSQLDAQTLLHDIYVTESSLLFPQTNLLVVMLTQEYGAQILLERLELSIDDRPVEAHRYTGEDLEKLMNRAHQVIYTALIPPGFHTLDAKLYGMGLAGGPRIETEFSIDKGSYPLFVELSISGDALGHRVWR